MWFRVLGFLDLAFRVLGFRVASELLLNYKSYNSLGSIKAAYIGDGIEKYYRAYDGRY